MITDLGFEQYPLDCIRSCPEISGAVEEYEMLTLSLHALQGVSNNEFGTDYPVESENDQSEAEQLEGLKNHALNAVYETIHSDIFTDEHRDQLIKRIRESASVEALGEVTKKELLPHLIAGAQLSVTEAAHKAISEGRVSEDEVLSALDEFDSHVDDDAQKAIERAERTEWWRLLHDQAVLKAKSDSIASLSPGGPTEVDFRQAIEEYSNRLLALEMRLIGCLACPGPVEKRQGFFGRTVTECAVEINKK